MDLLEPVCVLEECYSMSACEAKARTAGRQLVFTAKLSFF
jgi:hypothetical protein